MPVIKRLQALRVGTGPLEEAQQVVGRQIKVANPKTGFLKEDDCRPTRGFFETGRFPKDLGASDKVLFGTATFWGPDF